jgi:hypothetical protein
MEKREMKHWTQRPRSWQERLKNERLADWMRAERALEEGRLRVGEVLPVPEICSRSGFSGCRSMEAVCMDLAGHRARLWLVFSHSVGVRDYYEVRDRFAPRDGVVRLRETLEWRRGARK